MSHPPRPRTVVGCTLLVIALARGAHRLRRPTATRSPPRPYDAADQISFNAPDGDGKKADPDKPLEVTVKDDDGRITDVTAVDATGRYVAGELAADGSRWHSTAPLAAGAHYTVQVSTEDDDGAPGRRSSPSTPAAPAKKRLTVAFGPDAGEYGVGQPVTAKLGQPVKDPAAAAVVERGLKVTSTPAVQGAWHWVDDKDAPLPPQGVLARPRHRRRRAATWTASRSATGCAAARPSRSSSPSATGSIAMTDAASHYMTVFTQRRARSTQSPSPPASPASRPATASRSCWARSTSYGCAATTVGIAEGSSDSYDLPVYYATRVTWSGEYVHAAPWSVGSQGYANVSHGCTGMSTTNAEWFFDHVRQGDVVQVVNSDGDTMDAVRQRLRRLEPRPGRSGRRAAP